MFEATNRDGANVARRDEPRSGTRPRRAHLWRHDETEHDACAIIANVKKDGRASHGNVKRTLEALARMGHRTGEVEGEGDGAGLQTDIPRQRWAGRLEAVGLRGTLATRAQFTVAHIMIPHERRGEAEEIKRRALALFEESIFEVLVAEPARVRSEALGPLARASEAEFWQVAALPCTARGLEDRDIFGLTLRLERELPIHIVSLSPNSVIYKVRGDAETLRRYFPELSHPDFKSAITLGHGRYSTNTDSRPERAQMFSTLGHNGEINSIDRLGREALALGFQLPPRASDSQVLDRVVESFMFEYGLSLMNALEIVFPPVWSEIARFPADVRGLYRYWRRAFGAHAQGPAAIIARQADEVVFSSDALGLRPLWCGETEKEFFASSEKGVVPLEQMVRDPRPLAPGEKMGFLLRRERGVDVFEYHELQRRALEDVTARIPLSRLNASAHWLDENSETPPPDECEGFKSECEGFKSVGAGLVSTRAAYTTTQVASAETPRIGIDPAPTDIAGASALKSHPDALDERRLIALGWSRLDALDIEEMAATGKEPISGLGWDGPLAALSKQRRNVADYFQERVAVVTNPSIDREREADHFSTRVFLGAHPSLANPACVEQIELRTPLLLGGIGNEQEHAGAAHETKQRTLAEVLALCDGAVEKAAATEKQAVEKAATEKPSTTEKPAATEKAVAIEKAAAARIAHGTLRSATVDMTFGEGETLEQALTRLEEEAARLVRESRSSVLILDDARAHRDASLGIDAHLALAAVDARLRAERDAEGLSLRRHASIVLRAGSLRNVHDIVFALGCGADAVNPYAVYEVATRGVSLPEERTRRLRDCVAAFVVGIEKVLSTMGIHELDGYGRLFASIGLAPDVADYFGVANYCGSVFAGLSLCDLERDARERLDVACGASEEGTLKDASKKRPPALPGEFREQPSVWNVAGRVARGEQPYENFAARLRELEETKPVALRQLLEIRAAENSGFDSLSSSPSTGGVNTSAGGREVNIFDRDREVNTSVESREVDTSAGRHAAPFYFSAMSFGSQGETSFRAYAEGAKRLDIICVNGEGGEIPDMLGRYREHRGQQVASGRFGVNARLLNSCNLLEIKIGQGAKPGEGGLLPGFKVTSRIAETRHTPIGIDLISPSNNHDIYSIEDLAQVVEELKTINPRARISVKIPSVPHLGPVATGIAKARADIIAISGYDGGTGAARKHSLRHTGLPVEIGLREAHRALVRAGLRRRVELWADGGVKSGRDVVKLMLLGADRVGFATMAMAAIGCTSCRECNTGTCHVGITSQLKNAEEALAAGQKHFTPREYERAVEHLSRFFKGVKDEIKRETRRAGLDATRELVGRVDLLEQARGHGRLDLAWLLEAEEACPLCSTAQEPTVGRARRSLTSLTRVISRSVSELAEMGKEVVYYDDAYVSSGDRALGTHLSGKLTRARFAHVTNNGSEDKAINGSSSDSKSKSNSSSNAIDGSNAGNIIKSNDNNGNNGSGISSNSISNGGGGCISSNGNSSSGISNHSISNGDGIDRSVNVPRLRRAVLSFLEGAVPGNGLGAFNTDGVDIVVHGGVQDGAAKGASGGRIVILKGVNHDGVPVDGAVGKCFAYGAQAGLFIVQGNADSRAGIRLSGADLIFGGRLRAPLRDELGNIAACANLKGFAFEYQTSGRGLVLGDPGPWLCSGMTGGIVYLLLEEELGLTTGALRRRLAAGAKVRIESVADDDESSLSELLGHYRTALAEGQQLAEAEEVAQLSEDWRRRFVKVVPASSPGPRASCPP
jgi:glutamate synthase (NADPH/NADH) large chain